MSCKIKKSLKNGIKFKGPTNSILKVLVKKLK